MNKLITIAKAVSAFGIDGRFKIKEILAFDDILQSGMYVSVYPADKTSCILKEGQNFNISGVNRGNKIVLSLEGVDDRTIAQEMTPFLIKLDRKKFPKTKDYYPCDLLDLDVIDKDSRKIIGKVVSYQHNGVQVVIDVEGEKNFSLPMVKSFIDKVDINGGYIRITIPEVI